MFQWRVRMCGSSQLRSAWQRQDGGRGRDYGPGRGNHTHKIRDLRMSDIQCTTKSEMLFSLLIKFPLSFTNNIVNNIDNEIDNNYGDSQNGQHFLNMYYVPGAVLSTSYVLFYPPNNHMKQVLISPSQKQGDSEAESNKQV